MRLVIGFAAGGASDVVGRLVAQGLSERLGQPFIIENKPGAGSNLAAQSVGRAAPDGYTLLLVLATNAINSSLYETPSFDFIRDIAPVAGIVRVANLLEVNPAVPAKTVPEFIAYAKANPGKLSMASAGNGTAPHVAGELFKQMAGISMIHVPYRGSSPALTDLIAGQVNSLFAASTADAIAHIKAGTVRALAVTTTTRLDLLPDVPTVGEFLPGYEASGWQGIGAPMHTPAEIVERLNREVNAILAEPEMKARLTAMGSPVLIQSPAEFGKLMVDDTAKWAKVVKAAGIKAN